ncbi:MOSC domain-containing protein [Ferrimonas balearica]|uniref:MOSC domain-containing protein n=1 Tax=Ferrimonas balearica TaxID=44012 RepID=UPI001C994171|nr:MOSC N-terminal beta barrel domain-containing protein [Ferrimonas balearica]MBY5992381.1 MOSC N-terminal beta barrel domain-containing protein [Ferrimonas balearica]
MRIRELHLYPVKTLRGIPLAESPLGPLGLPWDRHWLVADAVGRALTLAQRPDLTQLTPFLSDSALLLSAPGHGELAIPLTPPPGPPCAARLGNRVCRALDEGALASGWLTSVLGPQRGYPLRLLRVAPSDEPRAPFNDGWSLTLATLDSLEALNRRLEEKGQGRVGLARFRPNLVVDSLGAPFHELFPSELLGPGYRLALVKPIRRCRVTRLHPRNGALAPAGEPLAALTELSPLKETPGPHFGAYVSLMGEGPATLAVDQPLSLHRR